MQKRVTLIVSIVFSFFLSGILYGQESKLANEYFRNGEYEKAAVLFKKLNDKTKGTSYYFNYYIKSLVAAGQDEEAEKILKGEIKKNPGNTELYVTYGDMLEQRNELEEAKKYYRQAIDNLGPDVSRISKLGNAFIGSVKYDMAEETYLKGVELLDNEQVFAYNLADLYSRKDQKDKMVYYYLAALAANPQHINSVKSNLHRKLNGIEEYAVLKEQLYARIQDYPDVIQYTELLQWAFVQEKDYTRAFRQARSLDRELDENGIRVYRLAALAEEDKDYDAAIKAYEYLTQDKGKTSSYYVNAKKSLLRCKRKSIMGDFVYTQSELDSLEKEYEIFLDEFGINTSTSSLVREYAEFQVVNMNNVSEAISLLEKAKLLQGSRPEENAYIKLDLADYYIIDNNIWEATLLYSQVDKAHKEEYVGELARFKNAKFSYFTGDFEWAQEQFDILKAATSRLISNDAIDLSVFIMDNMGLDTTTVPLEMYAEAELLAFQNKHKQAFQKLDSILVVFPEHGLKDDVLYTKANINKKLQNYPEAEEQYQEIIEKFPEDIRCDNAIFELAELYEYQLQDKEKAKALYEKLFIDYSNSTFAIDARKRFRQLRGDDIQ